jgi:hypothetical protein
MANRYAKIDKETKSILDEVLKTHQKDLNANSVKFDVLFGYAPVNDEGEQTGPALKIHGYPTNSISRIVNLRDRVKGNADAEVILDGDTWESLTNEQKAAVIDRALEQFELARNIDGEVITDNHGRPKLKMRQADWMLSMFNSIAIRHGAASPEVEQLKIFTDKCSQIYFPFMGSEEKELPALPEKE